MIPVWNRRLGAGLFLCSLSLLAHELVLVRIFSVLMWYHFVSLVISPALLGLMASGLVVFLLPHRFPPERSREWLGRFALLLGTPVYSVAVILSTFLAAGGSDATGPATRGETGDFCGAVAP